MKSKNWILVVGCWMLAAGCNNEDTVIPKPKGYLRVTFPEKTYLKYNDESCPFTFSYPDYAHILRDEFKNAEPCWFNIDFPSFKGKIHLSYKEVNNNLRQYSEDSRTFVIKHQMKASGIDEQLIQRDSSKVYGLLYDIQGNTASAIQFYLTDSVKHFVRGALYFNARPNEDSLAPVIDFIRKDIYKMVNTFEWKDH
jgi:gliding motility-associated lipoprotein GldD